jgi:hypothetical protein
VVLRTLRAFAWLRWRIVINSIERRASRDALERFSLAFEQLGPAIAFLLMVPSAVSLAAVSTYTGWMLAQGDTPVVLFSLLRATLLGGFVLAIVGPMILPAGERTSTPRLLLLPIPRSLLHCGQVMSTVADPWMMLVVAVVVSLPIGLGIGGDFGSAAIAGIGGALLLALLSGLSLVVTSTIHLIVRNRRRGELVALLLILALPIVGILPTALVDENREDGPTAPASVRDREPPGWWISLEAKAAAAVPSELFTGAVSAAVRSDSRAVGPRLFALAGAAGFLHLLAWVAFTRVLRSPGVIASSRAGMETSFVRWRVPGLTPAVSAVALNQLRLALRTPRGRSAILSPIVVFAVFALLKLRNQGEVGLGAFRLESGVGLAAMGAFVSLLAIVPLAMNQFAIDRAGLTWLLLSPLDSRSLLRGKAAGNAIVAAIPAGACLAGSAALFPGGEPALWISLLLTLVAIYVLVAPIAAVLSAAFPRAVDLNSIGRGSNAHGAAGLLGTLAFGAAGLPCLLLVLLATQILHRPVLAPLFLVAWMALSGTASVALFKAATALFERRRETLAMTASTSD